MIKCLYNLVVWIINATVFIFMKILCPRSVSLEKSKRPKITLLMITNNFIYIYIIDRVKLCLTLPLITIFWL